jgi:hypothetical protein
VNKKLMARGPLCGLTRAAVQRRKNLNASGGPKKKKSQVATLTTQLGETRLDWKIQKVSLQYLFY